MDLCKLGRQTLCAKAQCQEGNSPHYLLRSLSYLLVNKEVVLRKQPGGRLGSSHPLKKA